MVLALHLWLIIDMDINLKRVSGYWSQPSLDDWRNTWYSGKTARIKGTAFHSGSHISQELVYFHLFPREAWSCGNQRVSPIRTQLTPSVALGSLHMSAGFPRLMRCSFPLAAMKLKRFMNPSDWLVGWLELFGGMPNHYAESSDF